MPSYTKVMEEGEKVKTWERGPIIKYNDKYYWIDEEKEEVVLEGNFI